MSERYTQIASHFRVLTPIIFKYDYFFEGKMEKLSEDIEPVIAAVELTDRTIIAASKHSVKIFKDKSVTPLRAPSGVIINLLKLSDEKIAVISTSGFDIWIFQK